MPLATSPAWSDRPRLKNGDTGIRHTSDFVWEKTAEADFNSREGKKLDPTSPYCWDNSRRISSEFLETILFEKPFREAVTRKGVRIIGACFPEKVDLEDGYLPWPLAVSFAF